MRNTANVPADSDYINKLAHYFANVVIPTNPYGFTIDPLIIQTPVFNKSTFIVSLKDYEQRFYKMPELAEVVNWLSLHNFILSRPGHYIGGWRDNGIYFLDISIPVNGKVAALKTAYANQQVAIYHPFSGQSIYVPYKLPQVA